MDKRLKDFSQKVAEKIKYAHINRLSEITIDFPFFNGESLEKYLYYQNAYYNLIGNISIQYTEKIDKKKDIKCINCEKTDNGVKLFLFFEV